MKKHVTCPYCDYIYSDGDEAFMPESLTLASHFEEACINCGEIFIVIWDVRPVYHTIKKGVTT